MKAKLTAPRWQSAITCRHDFVEISKNYKAVLKHYRHKLCGHRKVK